MLEAGGDGSFNLFHIIVGALATIVGALSTVLFWLVKRSVHALHAKVYAHDELLTKWAEKRVTRDDFDELRSSMMASIISAVVRLEGGVEKRHAENRSDFISLRKEILDLYKGTH